MEGIIEKYIIDQLEDLKHENEILKKQNEELKVENGKIDSDKVIGLPTLGVYYDIDTHSWHLSRENLAQYKKALVDHDFKWLQRNGYEISGYSWNYEIHIGMNVARLSISFYDAKFTINQVRDGYLTKEEAEEALLKELAKDISEEEQRYAREDAKKAAESSENSENS